MTYDDIAESTAWLRGVLNETPTDRPGIHIGPPVDRLEITFRRPQPIFKIRIEGDLSGFTIIGLYPSGGRIILSSSVDAAPVYEVLTHAGASGPLEGLSLCSAGQSLIRKIEIIRIGFRNPVPEPTHARISDIRRENEILRRQLPVIKPSGGDDTVRIQRAIDELAARGGGDYTFPPRTRLGNSNIRIPANVRVNTSDDSSIVGTNFIQVPAPSPLERLTNAIAEGRERQQGARIPFSIRSNGGTHFTEALRYPQSSDANLVGLADNNIRIRRVTAQALQDLDMELMFWRSDTFDSVNINEDSFCGRVSLSHGRRASESGRYYYDVPNLDIPYEDLDGTYELHVALQNRGPIDKPDGDSGQVIVEVFYELGPSDEPAMQENPTPRRARQSRRRHPTPAFPAGTCQGCGGRGTATNSHTLSEGPCEICHGSGRSPSAEQGIDDVAIMNPVSHRRRRPRYRGHRRRDWSRRHRRRRRALPPRDGHGRFARQTPRMVDGVGDSVPVAPAMGRRGRLVATQESMDAATRRALASASMESNLSVDPITQDVYRSEPHIIEIPITTNNPLRGTNMVVGDYTVPTGIEFMFTPEQKPLFRIKPLGPPEANWKRRFGITIDIMDAMLAQLIARVYNAKLEDYENPQVPEDNHFRIMGRARQGDRIRVLIQNDTENMREWDLQVRLQATRLIQHSREGWI